MLFNDGLTFPQLGLFMPGRKPRPNVRLPLIEQGLLAAQQQEPAPIEERVIPPSPQAGQPATLNDRFAAALNNPMFVMGASLLAGGQNPWGEAVRNGLAVQQATMQGKREEQRMAQEARRIQLAEEQGLRDYELGTKNVDIGSRNAATAEGRLSFDQSEFEAMEPYRQAQLANMGAQSQLHQAQAIAAMQEQQRIQAAMEQLGLFGAPQPTGSDPMQQQTGMPPAAPAGAGLPPGVNPQAMAMDFAFNKGRGIPDMMVNASKPIAGANGIIYRQGPNGLEIDPTSMEAFRQMQSIQAGADASMDFVQVPQPDGSTVMMRRDVAAAQAGGLPAPATPSPAAPAVPSMVTPQQPATPAPGGVAATNFANNNFGNIRPPGKSKGFMSYSTPEEGVRAVDNLLSIYGNKHGIDTVAGVVNRWLGGGADGDNVAAITKNISSMTGFSPNDKIDLSNPATRQIVGAAIMRQEHPNAFKAQSQPAPAQGGTGVVGRTPSAEQKGTTEARTEQNKQISADWGKTYIQMQHSARKAGTQRGNMEMLRGYLRNVNTGTLAGSTLALSKFADAFGFKIPAKAKYAEASRSLANQMILEMRSTAEGEGLPGATSNFEVNILIAMQPNIDKLPGANEILAEAYIKRKQRTIEEAKIMADYRKQNGVIDDGVLEVIEQYRAANPIFTPEQVEMIENANVPQQPQQQPQPQAQATDILPGGARRISNREVVGTIKPQGAPSTLNGGGVKFLGFE